MRFRWQILWIGGLLFFSIGSYLIFPEAPLLQHLQLRSAGPSWSHILGTDALGRDVLARVLEGARFSLFIGAFSTLISILIGSTYGSISGYIGGAVDYWMMRLVDVIYALPLTLIVLLLMIYFGNGLVVLCLAIGLTQWLTLARVVRAQTLDLRQRTFTESAYVLGQSHWKIIRLYILPGIAPLIGAYALILLPEAILLEAFLSFLGLGIPPPYSSWGNMIVEGSHLINSNPLQLLIPALFLVLTLWAFTTLKKQHS